MRPSIHLLPALLLLPITSALATIPLASNGKTDYVITLAPDAIPAEQSAARELADRLKDVTGAEFPIRADAAGAKRIIIGAKPDKDLGPDGIVIRTIGDTLHLTGTRPRGSLYAVNTFLEDLVGVRWWTSTESFTPKRADLSIPDVDVAYTPPLRYREDFYRDAMRGNALFASRLKLNGHHHNIPAELGGHYSILGWCHTFYRLIPPGEFFGTHPEWFSLLKGQRTATNAQLCLTNESMRQELVRRALKLIAKNPDAGMISISQNDCYGACGCDACAAIAKEEGSQAGPMIRFVNAVAADIAKEYPNVLVETLAYQYTRKPPTVTKPARNVIVRLCSIEADFARPLSGAANASFGDDLRGWAAIAPNLFVWNYVTNFADYLIPHPNLPPLGEDLRFFTENRTIGVFEQGDALNSPTGDFLPLRTWLIAKLLWKPSADQRALTREFLNGYYGAAGPYLEQYLDLVAEGVDRTGTKKIGCYNKSPSYLSDRAVERATKLFDDAAKAVAGDDVLALRLRRERLALEHVRLIRWNVLNDADCAGYEAAAKAFVAEANELGVRNLSEAVGFAAYVPQLLSRCTRAKAAATQPSH